jgi:hypothetical protein
MTGPDSRRLRFGSFGEDRFDGNSFSGHMLRFGGGLRLRCGSGRFAMSSRDCHMLRFGSRLRFGEDRLNGNAFSGDRLRFGDRLLFGSNRFNGNSFNLYGRLRLSDDRCSSRRLDANRRGRR